jgi:hypothetical protein
MTTLDKNKIQTLGDDEKTPMDRANDRVRAEMKLINSEAKEQVAQGLDDPKLSAEAERLKQEAQKELNELESGE